MADIAQLQFLNLFLKQLVKKLTFIQQFFFQVCPELLVLENTFSKIVVGWVKII